MKIYSLIPKIMAEIGPIGKDGVNAFQKYKFRGIDQMYNGIQPALVKFGVFCVPQVLESQSFELEGKDGKTSFRSLLKVSHKFYADDGSFVDVITIGEGIDTSDKATNKAMSAAMKYAFIELFSVPTEDIADSDKDSPEAGKQRGGSGFVINSVSKVDSPKGMGF
jgi:hypothetical protein